VSVFKGALGEKRIFRMKGSFSIAHLKQAISIGSTANTYAYFKLNFQNVGKPLKNMHGKEKPQTNECHAKIVISHLYI
jgi:hypothetical protein